MARRTAIQSAWIALVLISAGLASVWVIDDSRMRRALMSGRADLAPGRYQAFAASMLAEQLFEKGDINAAGAAARQALRTHSGDVPAIRTLALVAEKQGQFQQTAGLMAMGARWSWRDTPTQVWLFAHLTQEGKFAEAILHGEALAARDELPDYIFPAFAALAAEPAATKSLTAALDRGANWRSAYYQYMRKAPSQLHPALGRLMLAMQKSTASPSQSDVSPLLEAMLDAGNTLEARDLWRKLFWRRAEPMPAILDGGFDGDSAKAIATNVRSVFGWQFDPSAQLYIVADPAGGNNEVLNIVSAGSGHGALAGQRLALEPGAWVLSLRLRSGLPELSSRLRIGIRCSGGGEWLTEEFREPTRTDSWQVIDLPLTVAVACRSQSLSVEPIGTAPGDAVEVWIDDIAVHRNSGGNSG